MNDRLPALTQRPHRGTLLATLSALTLLAACGGGDDGFAGLSPVAPPAPAPVPAPPPPAPAPAAPLISTDLPATLMLAEGESGALAVAADSPGGGELSYRWLRNGVPDTALGTAATAEVAAEPFRLSYPGLSLAVEVSNAVGTTTSATVQVQRSVRSWLDAGVAHPQQDYATVGDDGQLVSFADADGRVHIASVHSRYEPSFVNSVTFKGHSKDGEADTWGYEAALPTLGTAWISSLGMAATVTGEIVAVWQEIYADQGVERTVVRAALYRPGASAAQGGSWALIGTVSDPLLEATSPSVVSIGAGAFGMAWLQRSNGSQPRDAVMRRFDVPAAGEPPHNGLGSLVAMEGDSANFSRLQVVGTGGPALAFLYREPSGSTPGKWQSVHSAQGMQWTAPADLALDHRFERIHWAQPVNGLTVLGAADGNGRVFLRRADVSTGTFPDSSWSYNANAYGSAPALLIDAAGRIDVFGVSVNTAAGHTSVLAHWTRPAGGTWGSADILVSSSSDFRQGLGLRNPVAGRDAQGNIVLAWLERPTVNVAQTVQAMRYSHASAGWTAASPVALPAAATTSQTQLSLQVSPNGRATAAWVDAELGGTDRVMNARLR